MSALIPAPRVNPCGEPIKKGEFSMQMDQNIWSRKSYFSRGRSSKQPAPTSTFNNPWQNEKKAKMEESRKGSKSIKRVISVFPVNSLSK